MRKPDLCKEMLQRLLNIKIKAIDYPDEQKTIDITSDGKSVRLDICPFDAFKKAFTATRLKTYARKIGIKSEDDFVRRLDDEVEEARKNEKWRREYMTLLMRDQENREEGRAEGRAEGDYDACVRIARKMISDGMDSKTAAKYSGLPLEEVESLKRLQTV